MGVTRKERLLKAMLEDNSTACRGGVTREERYLAGVGKKMCDVAAEESPKAHQILVTDKNGESKWEDRTHYKGFVEYERLIDNQTLNFTAEMNAYFAELDGVNIFDEMNRVIWDGEEYRCLGVSTGKGFNYLGNQHILFVAFDGIATKEQISSLYPGLEDIDSGEPFFFTDMTDGNTSVTTLDKSPTHTITLSLGEDGVAKKLDLAYLPTIIITKWGDNVYDCNIPFEEFEAAVMGGAPMVYIDRSDEEYRSVDYKLKAEYNKDEQGWEVRVNEGTDDLLRILVSSEGVREYVA